jgi:farnesyl diphosphate synthase/geranylgeranyl diphosphate synthase type II
MPNAGADALATGRSRVDEALAVLCRRELADVTPSVKEAVRYCLLGEGKRLRALLVIEAYRAAGGVEDPSGLAAAVEIVHAYSLIHDDLPCMDNDNVRRGRPTVHRMFGVPLATVAGATMVPLAARAAFAEAQALGLSRSRAAGIVAELMRASGAGGMIAGQLLDLEAEGRQLDLAQLERVHRSKTGMLIAAAARIGAVAAQADAPVLAVFTRYGEALGLAFQIADDVLDVTSTTDQLGKTAGRDALLRKSTYPGILGVDGALVRARALAKEACDALRAAGVWSRPLEELAAFVVERKS